MIDYRNIPLEAKKREIEDYRKLLPQAKSIYDQPKEFVYKIDYDAKHDTADVLREFYQASDDPSSRIKQQGAAQIVKLLNPEMDPAYIERNIGKLIEASVGQKLDYENTFDEFVSTFKSSSNDLRIGAKYMDLYIGSSDIFDTEEFEAKKSELLDEVRRMPAQKRTDYMPLALLTDMLVSTGNILPSSLPSVGMYLAGGVVNAVAPGLGTLLAKAGSSTYTGFQEAGGTLKTLVDFRDSEGNQLSDEAIWTITQMVWAGVTAVNFFTDPFEKMFSTGAQKLASRVITKESVKGILKSGNSSVWKAIAKGAAKKGVMDVVEGVQEMAEDLVDILAVNAGVKKYNEEYDTDFTTTSYEEAKKELASTFKETTKGMFFMSLPGNVTSTFKNINSKSSTAMRDANKVSGFTKDSQVISPSSVVIPKSVKGMDTFKESAGPIEVVKVGDSYIPTNKNDASFFASIKEKGTKGVNVVVQNQTGESTTTASVFAENIADKLALGWKDNAVVFESAKDAKKAAEKFAINSQGRVTGYTEANGVYTISLESNGEIHDIVFTHKNNITDYTKSEVREDSKPTPTNTEQTTNNAKDIKGVARKFNTADSKKLQKQIKKAMPRLSPNENKIAAAMFGMMAEAQDMTIDEFLEANYKNGEIFGSAKDGALDGFRGYVEFGDDLKAVIYAAEHSDFSTFSHETFHVAFRSLGKQAEFSQIIQDAAATEEFHTWVSEHGQLFEDNVFKDVNLSEFAKTFMDSEWSNTHEEFLARVFEGYLSDGKSLSPKLKPLLAIISDWFKEIYHSIKHTVDLDSRIVEAFDSMLDKDTKLQAEVRGEATVDATMDATTDTTTESTDTTGKPTILFQESNGKRPLEKRVSNDYLLDVKDMIDEIIEVGGKVNDLGIITVYHATSKNSAEKIKKTGRMIAKEDGLFFSTKSDGQITGYGESVVKFEIPAELLIIDDIFKDEAHLVLELGNSRSKNIGMYDPSILFQEAPPTDSEAFKKWFGDSKVVDENGKPLEVYHGSEHAGFTEFNNSGEKKTSAPYGAIFFTNDVTTARSYSGDTVGPEYGGDNAGIYKVFLKMSNPFVKDFKGASWLGINDEQFRIEYKGIVLKDSEGYGLSFDTKEEANKYIKEYAQENNIKNLSADFEVSEGVGYGFNTNGITRDIMKEGKYDGIIFKNVRDRGTHNEAEPSDVYVVFDSKQIKSVDNNGTWDSADPNILHQSEVKPLSKNSKEYKETKKRVQDMLENKEYPKDHELALFKGEEWADKEISFRRLYAQDDMLVSKFEKAYDAYIDEITSYDEKTGEEVVTPAENENKRILEILHEQDRTTFDNIEDSIGDTESFIGRMKQQIELMTPKVADQGFKAALSDDSFVLEVASMLTGDLDPTQDSDISKYLFRLANDENPSGHTLRYARKALIDNVREYRRMIYEMDGETAQLSYERAIEGTEIGEGVESLGVSNTEVKNLLNSDLSEEIKAMIEENIATDTTLTAIIEDNLSKATSIENKNRSIKAMSDNIAEINERIAEITAELEQQADETASLDEGRAETLQKLKDKSKALSRAKADLKRVKIARDALKTKAAIKKITSKLDVHAKDSVNTADARMTSLMQKFLSVLRAPNTEGIDYRILLKNIGVDFNTLPGVLKSYFVASDDVLLLKSTLSNMSIDEIIQLEKDMKEMKAAARHLLTERKEKSRSASNWVKTEFYSQRTGEKFATVEDYHDYVDNLKYESGPKTSKSKESQKWLIKSMFETNLLTGSRWVRRIDGKMNGAVSKWIFGGELEDGTVWKGVEGVIDQELKRSNERIEKAIELMRKEGLTDKHMIGKFKINGEPVVMRGQTITNQRAIAVYIYDQQKKGKVLLRSLDGNGFTDSEVEKIIDNLTESQKRLGDFMIEDFASVRGEVEETYYKVNNKILGWEDNYFPLVGTGDNARFSSVLESNQGKPSGDPRHTFTEQRTGEIYKLNLDVVTSWASMVKQQEHYIAGAEYFSQTQNLMNKHGGDLYSAISETKGPVYAAKLQEFIDGLADHKTALDEADSAINAVRNNLIVARLGFNVITALKQIPSFGAFAMEYGPVELAKAFIQVGTDYKGSMELINEMAPQIKYRSFTSGYQALMNIEGTSQYKLAKKGFAQFSMGLIKAMDKAVVNTLWIGSYNNSIAHNLSPEMAAMKATKFINDTQPTGNFKDNAMLYSSSSPIWKFLLMFTNQLNKYLNIAYDIPFELKEHMYHQAIGSIVSLGINTAGIVLLSGGMLRADGDDDDEYWDKVLGEIQGTMLSIVPVVGPLVAPIVKNQYFPDTSMPMVSELAQLWSANKVEDPEKRKEKIEKALINMGFGGAEVGGFAAGAGKKIYKSLTEENIWYLLNSAYGDRMGNL